MISLKKVPQTIANDLQSLSQITIENVATTVKQNSEIKVRTFQEYLLFLFIQIFRQKKPRTQIQHKGVQSTNSEVSPPWKKSLQPRLEILFPLAQHTFVSHWKTNKK